jgi:hypothetical protein
VTVALTDAAPTAHGRRWTAAEYARRDAVLAGLGIVFGKRHGKETREQHGQHGTMPTALTAQPESVALHWTRTSFPLWASDVHNTGG